ncbi:MAG: polyphosphate polymerase domain-containing protein [Ruminococcaceae bacterium]|nr:polyphosphate polymerase domain-containing protein [Oscillospiraceae bacterium]
MKFRNECKHHITEYEAVLIRQRLKHIAHPDEYATRDGTYMVHSLYFDNCYDKALNEKQAGYNTHEKFRIRYYNQDHSFIRLEKKSKVNGLCLKDSCNMTVDEVVRILNYDFDWMKASSKTLVLELWSKMQYQLLRPKSIVSYRREAFTYAPGNVRVTIDSDIRGESNIVNFLDHRIDGIRLFNMSILEIKWNDFLPQIIRDVVQLDNIKTRNFSKYAATRFDAF